MKTALTLLSIVAATSALAQAPQPRKPPARSDHSGFGRSLAFCGDLDGDKCSEIAVGSRSEGAQRQGAVFVYSGRTGELIRPIAGEVPSAGFGTELCNAGDQDGDSVPDLAVAVPLARHAQGSGAIEIRSGKDGTRIKTLYGADEDNYFGTNLVSIGDVDGDKKDDLLVRMRVDLGPKEHERFEVVSPGSGKRLFTIDAPVGELCRENGVPVCALGDIDGDETADFAVAYGSQVFIHSGKEGKRIRVFGKSSGFAAEESFGHALCGMPEQSRNGQRVIVAVSEPAGGMKLRVFLQDGREAGITTDGLGFSIAQIGKGSSLVASRCSREGGGVFVCDVFETKLEIVPVEAQVDGTPIGWRVAGGADVNGDGAPDFMVSRWWPTAAAGAEVLAFSGKDRAQILRLVPGP